MTPLQSISLALAASVTAIVPAVAQQGPPTVTVTVASYSFTPRPIMLRAGQPVRLSFVNTSGSGHDFKAKQFFAAARILAGSAPDGEIELQGHQTATIDLIPAAGT